MTKARGTCRFCGREGAGISFDEWVKPTFVNWDDLVPGDIVCDDCLFWFDEQSVVLAQRVGKSKPQRMRTYSHFVKNGKWTPLSKAQKAEMVRMLLEPPFPELAAISVSGQKHIVFRARRNPPGQDAGWVQFEEIPIFVEPAELRAVLELVTAMLNLGFSKASVESGVYNMARVHRVGLTTWWPLEEKIRSWRGKPIFSLAVFLAQREEEHDGTARENSGTAHDHLAGDSERLQISLSDEHLEAV